MSFWFVLEVNGTQRTSGKRTQCYLKLCLLGGIVVIVATGIVVGIIIYVHFNSSDSDENYSDSDVANHYGVTNANDNVAATVNVTETLTYEIPNWGAF